MLYYLEPNNVLYLGYPIYADILFRLSMTVFFVYFCLKREVKLLYRLKNGSTKHSSYEGLYFFGVIQHKMRRFPLCTATPE